MNRRIRILIESIAAGSVAVVLAGSGANAASDTPKVYGYITGANATPVVFQYNQPSFGVPSTPTFEIRYMYSAAQADSGPASHAISSIAWPGDLAGNAPPSLIFESFLPPDLITQTDSENASYTQFRDGLINGTKDSPPYPIRGESFYPQGPAQNSSDVGGGVSMATEARERLARAVTTGSKAGFPGLVSASDMNASSFSGIRDGIAVSEAQTAIKEMSVLNGLIEVKSFRIVKTVTSDGVKATIGGSEDLSGLTIAGVHVFGVQPGGPRVGDQGIAWDQARKQIHDRLEPQGITVKLVQSEQRVDGASASSHVPGVAITLDSHAMAAFADSLPEPLRTALRNPGSGPLGQGYNQLPGPVAGAADSIVQFDQSMTVILGDVSVNSVASTPFDASAPVIPGAQPPPSFDGGAVLIPTQGGVSPPPPGTSVVPPSILRGAVRPVGTKGVPAAMSVLVFLIAAGATGGLRRFADRATTAAKPIERCSLST